MPKCGRKLTLRQSEAWYSRTRTTYRNVTEIVSGTLESLIKEKGFDYLSVTGRAKSCEGFVEKIRRKGYRDPTRDIHDLSGIRVIVYIESDATRVADLVKSSFRVHADKSIDKTSELGIDKSGYRSVHLVCDLGPERAKLPEYAPYKDMTFEIQIRTVLQHAWAEIEHDRNYKFAGVLPDHLQRRLYLAAGTLEMVDREFDSLSTAIGEYCKDVAEKTKRGVLDIPLNSTSLFEYMRMKYQNNPNILLRFAHEIDAIAELRDFGLSTIKQLDVLLNSDVVTGSGILDKKTTDFGLLRDAMILTDVDRYFKSCWKKQWSSTDHWSLVIWKKRYGEAKVNELLETHKIYIHEDLPIN